MGGGLGWLLGLMHRLAAPSAGERPPSPLSPIPGLRLFPAGAIGPCFPTTHLLLTSSLPALCLGPTSSQGEAPSWASRGARSASCSGQAHITVRAPSTPAPPFQDPCQSPAALPDLRGLRGALLVFPTRAAPPWGPGTPLPGRAGLGAPSSASSGAHRAPWRPTFSGEVSPGPEGGKRFS